MTFPKIFDRVKDSTTTTGTGTITLANSAPSGFQTWASAGVSNGDYIKYCIAGQSSGLWEVGFGVYNSAGPTITRVATQVEAGSSGAGVLVNLTGTSDVFSVDSAVSHGGNAFYGDFSQGVLVFDGTSVVAGVTPSANTYTLTQHVYGTVITINSGVTIKCAGFILFGLLMFNNGSVNGDGGNASGGTLGAAQWHNNNPLPGGVDGLVGKTVAGAGGQPSALSNSYGGAGGAGGADGQGHAGGGSGGVNVPNANIGAMRHYPYIIMGNCITRNSTGVQNGAAGNGGASGAFNTGTSSGAGGGGGGWCAIVCKVIVNNGTMSSNGGNGGNATGSGNAGGGGSGGGGMFVCIYNQFIGNNPTCAAGTTAGTGIGTGSSGSLGSAGTVFLISNS